jgi:hypothetical protein
VFIGACCAMFLLVSRSACAQVPASSRASTQPLRVFLTCDGCDAALRTAVTFVEFVTDRDTAGLEVLIEAQPPQADVRSWVFTYTGNGVFANQNRKLALSLPAAASTDEVAAGLSRVFKFGLIDYVMQSDAAARLDVTFKPTEAGGHTATATTPVRDPWHHWVFRLGLSTDKYGERTQSSGYYSGNVSANRTTDDWKIRISGYKSGNTSRFMVSEEETVHTKEGDWSFDSLVVRSLGDHWSAGFTTSLTSSTYSNQHRVATFNPAIEFDVFPYSESSQRSLTIQYAAGPSHYEYAEITLYGKLREMMPRHSVTASLGLRQPWGTAGASAVFSQTIDEPAFNRLTLNGSANVRVFKGLTVNVSGSFARIRDQFYLEQSRATEEEILLRLRQLATGHRYSVNFGMTYSFGSLSNATVNPRFGG